MWWCSSSRCSVKAFGAALAAAAVFWSAPLWGATPEVRIDIIKTPGRKLRIALPAFFDVEKIPDEAIQMREILKQDLTLSGFFEVITEPSSRIALDGLEAVGNPASFDRLVEQKIELLINVRDRSHEGKLILEGYVFDPYIRQQVFGKRYHGPEWARVKMIHILAGEIIQDLTGIKPLTKCRLAFLWNTSGKKQVFVSDYDGRDPKAVSPAGELGLFPEWLPDARSLVYTSFVSGFPELVYQDVDGGYQKILASFPGMNSNASFSPDGKNFLLTLSKDGNPEIYKLDLRGSVLQRLTHDQGVDTSPCYSPDGTQFSFVSDRSGKPQIYLMSANGGKSTRITFNGNYNVSPDWSPSGKHIAYSSMISGQFELMTINPASGEVAQLTAGPGNKEDPDWGPDDRHLVFTLTKDYKSDLYVVDVFSKETVRLTKGKGDFSSPSWSSGGP